ncbi:MAG: hypothetical protein GQ532_06795 [Methylomarinum sp.]|nr:hypothetical protein [Methylomarinum sp.]
MTGLTKLEQLDLGYNHKITNLKPLAGLTNLERLLLTHNQITNIEPLAGLTKLQFLILSTQSRDVRFSAKLKCPLFQKIYRAFAG